MKAAAFFLLLASACAHSGTRELSQRELDYFKALSAELARSDRALREIASGNRVTEERAISEVVQYQAGVEASRFVYSVREVLTAPASDRAPLIQATRNKVILLQLASLADLESERVKVELAIGDDRRRQLAKLTTQLRASVGDVIETGEAIHRYLDRNEVAQLLDVVAETKRQLDAFQGSIAEAEQSNSAVIALQEKGDKADRVVTQTSDAINRLVDLWSRLNKLKE
jgi:hypothetical protein